MQNSATYRERIESLRSMMSERGWDAVVLTGSDPHASEYPSERWKQVKFLTGFTGEAGDVVVTADHAGLWTDTRYFIQAIRQLEGTGVELHRTRVPDQVLIPEWLAAKFEADTDETVVAVDGLAMSSSDVEQIRSAMLSAGLQPRIESVPNLLEEIWPDRPLIPQTPVFTVESGESGEERLAAIRREVIAKGADGMLLSALDEIAWTLNVRASDIEYNPLVISYLFVGREETVWFVLKGEVEDPETEEVLQSLEGVSIERYDAVAEFLAQGYSRVLFDESSLNYELLVRLSGTMELIPCKSPVKLPKSVKNATEQEGMMEFHVRDGVAMEKFLYWLEKSLDAGRRITEWDAAVQLGRYRSEIQGYRGDSFETISAYGAGAALPHYITPNTDAPVLDCEGLYLCDSGGQYYDAASGLGATTDITRTVPLGPCSELEKEDYTLVLKGHIDLAMAVFPSGTAGCQIDALAREPLWRHLRNFGHGTGHGVGYFLGCHEGPQDVRQNFNAQPLLPGMVISDEPGIYREGMHGVRHENLLLCREVCTNEFGTWLGFEPLTLCHFDTSALDTALLTDEEKIYLNGYNNRVRETLSPLLPEEVAAWLELKTEAI